MIYGIVDKGYSLSSGKCFCFMRLLIKVSVSSGKWFRFMKVLIKVLLILFYGIVDKGSFSFILWDC